MTGTSKSHQRAHAEAILQLVVIVPPTAIAAAFERTTEGFLNRSLACRRETAGLAALRDVLLPKLVSGELRVADAERIVGQHV